jgi:hypothetical protein
MARALSASYCWFRSVKNLRNTGRSFGVLVSLWAIACATEVSSVEPDPDGQGAEPNGGSGGSVDTGGKPPTSGSSGSSSTAGTVAAFGGTVSTGGSSSAGTSAGGNAGSGTGGTATAGSGGSATGGGGGTAGTSAGGKGGTGGSGGSSTGGGGSPPVGTGSCADTPAYVKGTYALNTLVFATCNGGTPCTKPMPALTSGKTYEFKCLDQYNCGNENPGSTNWTDPPWQATKACEE